MMEPELAYFLKRYYGNIIKWWFVEYNPESFRIWPSEKEKRIAMKKEARERARLEAEKEEIPVPQAIEDSSYDNNNNNNLLNSSIDDSSFNATTGSYSGLYGQAPVDDDTKLALDMIMQKSSSQNSIDSLLMNSQVQEAAPVRDISKDGIKDMLSDAQLPPEGDDVLKEANLIYERLMREAAEDEARKQEEIEAARQYAMNNLAN